MWRSRCRLLRRKGLLLLAVPAGLLLMLSPTLDVDPMLLRALPCLLPCLFSPALAALLVMLGLGALGAAGLDWPPWDCRCWAAWPCCCPAQPRPSEAVHKYRLMAEVR